MLILIIWNLILRLSFYRYFLFVYFTAPRGKRQSSILFSCDRAAGRGSPLLMSETQGCSATFQWRTDVVCPPKKMECKLAGQHQTYDLRTLSSLTEPWKFSNGHDSWVSHHSLICPSWDVNEQYIIDKTVMASISTFLLVTIGLIRLILESGSCPPPPPPLLSIDYSFTIDYFFYVKVINYF